MFILILPVLVIFYLIVSFDPLQKKIIGALMWADILFIAYSAIPTLDGEHLAKSFLYAIPITVIFYFTVLKLLDLGIALCDWILKKTR